MRNLLFFHLKKQEQAMSNKSAGTILQNVNQDTLKGIHVAVPPKSERELLQTFNAMLNSVFGQMGNLEAQNQELTALRDWLLPLLMNGQVVVRSEDSKIGRSEDGKPGLSMAAEGAGKYGKKGKA